MDNNIKTTVIIPNYNGMKYLPGCLASLEALEEPFAICIVDNGSADGSVEWLKQYSCKKKKIQTIFLPENTGFCGAVNTGILQTDTPYVLLLNNDTRVLPGFVRALEQNLEDHPDTFSAGAKMLVMKQPELIDDAGDLYCALGWAYGRGKGKPETGFDKPAKIFAACGGACIYRRSVLNEIGLLDENHFAYLEDVDLGYRAQIYGYVNRYEPKARVLHAGSAVSGSRHNAFKVNLSSRNSIYLIWKNQPFLQHLLNFPFIFTGVVVKTLFFLPKHLAGNYIRGVCQGVKLALSKEGRAHKVHVKLSQIGSLCKIQFQLWKNLFRLFL